MARSRRPRPRMPKFEVGQRVVLPGEPPSRAYPQGLIEEHAVVGYNQGDDGFPDMYIVHTTPQDEHDDGIREVHEDDMREPSKSDLADWRGP